MTTFATTVFYYVLKYRMLECVQPNVYEVSYCNIESLKVNNILKMLIHPSINHLLENLFH
jgi:hypothetical protein